MQAATRFLGGRVRDSSTGRPRGLFPLIAAAGVGLAVLAFAAGRDTGARAAGSERPFKAYAMAVSRDEPRAAPASALEPAATAVGVPAGIPVSATIGAAGGTLSTLDGTLKLTIPAGALLRDTVLGIQPITNLAHGGFGPAYRLTPDGQRFQAPVTLTFRYAEEDLEGSSVDVLGAAFQTPDGFWQWEESASTDPTTETFSIATNHFTDRARVRGLHLRPPSQTVRTGKTATLQVRFCYDDNSPGAELPSLGYNCEAAQSGVPASTVSRWTLRGAGSVIGNGTTASYRAPNTVPNPNTVTVTATVPRRAGARVLLNAQITVADGDWSGTFSANKHFQSEGGVADIFWSGQVTFGQKPTEPPGTYYAVAGSYTIRIESTTDVCFIEGKMGTTNFDGANASSLHVGSEGGYVGVIKPNLYSKVTMKARCPKPPPDWIINLDDLNWNIPMSGDVATEFGNRVISGNANGLNGWFYSLTSE